MKLPEIPLPHVPKTYFLLTFEWRSASSSIWRRENEPIEECPGVWWANYLERYRKLEERKQAKYAETGLLCDAPTGEDYRFVGATPITAEGYSLLKYGPDEDDDEVDS